MSVGRPPPSFRMHPFFRHLKRFLLGISYFLDTYLTSYPLLILVMVDGYLFNSCKFFFFRILLIWTSDHGSLLIESIRFVFIFKRNWRVESEGQVRQIATSFIFVEDAILRALRLEFSRNCYVWFGLSLIFFHFNILGIENSHIKNVPNPQN